jgi:VCBS repeat-containing protein
VSSVGVPANGTYGTGQDLDFSVNFTKVVTVNTGGGVPYIQLTLDTGGTVDATYLSGAGSSALVFRYAVPNGELDTNGITVGSNLVLNGGAIQDTFGNNAAVALNGVGSTAGVLVDSIPPTVTSINTAGSAINNLTVEQFIVTFSTDVSLNPPDTADFSLHTTGTVLGTIASIAAVTGSVYAVAVTGVTGGGTMRLDLNPSGNTITDAFGNVLTAAHAGDQSYTIDHTAPQITAVTASPSSGIEGVGQTVAIDVAFGEAVTVTGGTPTLSLSDNGTAIYDAAATAALHDPTKLVFDYTVGVGDTPTSQLAVTGISLHGAAIGDLAGNPANLGNVATTFAGLGVDSSLLTANPDSNHVFAGQTVTADAAHGVLANDTDSNPADHVVVSAVDGLAAEVNQPVAGAYGSLTMHADGSYSYTANNTATGVEFDTFTYAASNGHSPASISTLTVEVDGTNQNFVYVPAGGSATGGFGSTVLDGSAGNATLTAATTFNAHQILVGGPGDTLNAGSFGQDTFVFANNFGHETINNFHPALDVIQLQYSQFGSLAAVMADIQQVGANSVLPLDANHVITITNTQHTSLTAADFHLV